MELKLKENLNTKSLVLKHNIVLDATILLEGREGVLETEKDIYLMISMVNSLIEEDLLKLCNEDSRDLTTIIVEDIEPFFIELLQEEKYIELFEESKKALKKRCKEIWENQHSIVGVANAILVALENITDDDRKEILEKTGELAKEAYDNRTEKLAEAADVTNKKLQELIAKYQKEDDTKENEE